jgi:hypothetical protein
VSIWQSQKRQHFFSRFLHANLSNCPAYQYFGSTVEVASTRSDAVRAIAWQAFLRTSISTRRAMDAYMAADAQGYQQIRPVAPVAMMDYQRRTPATTTTAKAVPLQHALTESPKES